MSLHPQLGEAYDLYAISALEGEARREIGRHLELGCPECLASVRQAELVALAIATGASPVAPSPRVARNLRRALHGARPAPAWRWAFAAAAVAAVVLALFGLRLIRQVHRLAAADARLRAEGASLVAQLRQSHRDTARARQTLALIAAPDTTAVDLAASAAKPYGQAFVNPRRGIVLVGERLPPLSADRTYEMWLLPRAGLPRPAGIFQAQADGSALHAFSGPLVGVAGIAVSVEPAGGTAALTGPIVLSSKFAIGR